jgi:hypothetical protein
MQKYAKVGKKRYAVKGSTSSIEEKVCRKRYAEKGMQK